MDAPTPNSREQSPSRSAQIDERAIDPAEREQSPPPPLGGIERAILPGRWPHVEVAALARGQRGLVTSDQLRELGVSTSAIGRATARGSLHTLWRGVYAVAPLPALDPLARQLGAVLVLAPDAWLSHDSAAGLWGLRQLRGQRIHVTVTGDRGRALAGIDVHRVSELDPCDTRRRHGIPVTAPARTLIDLAADLSDRELERIFDEALARRTLRVSEMKAALERHTGRRGIARARRLVDADRPTAMTRSEAEERFLSLVRRSGLPHPETNVLFEGFEVDFLCRAERVVVEIDGHTFHSSRRALERDHQRDARLQASGVMVLRFTWRELLERPEAVLVTVAAALARRLAA